jgi:hypothetical protein
MDSSPRTVIAGGVTGGGKTLPLDELRANYALAMQRGEKVRVLDGTDMMAVVKALE